MNDEVSVHYGGAGGLAGKIAARLRATGKDLEALTTRDLAAIDEFHVGGREATLELAARMGLAQDSRVLDIGSGLGGPARTLAGQYACHVTGIDLTAAFCEAAGVMSEWVGLADKTVFVQGDATDMPFGDDRFDAAITLHAAMNIAAKDRLYAQARRVLRRGAILAVFDILQGEGGEALYPAPWARDAAISHLATPAQMEDLLVGAGFRILEIRDSTGESLDWLESRTARRTASKSVPVSVQILFGDDFPRMVSNQIIGLRERRLRTVGYICEA